MLRGVRVAIVTPLFLGADGVGRSTASKLRMLEEAGHSVAVYTDRPELATFAEFRDRVRYLAPRDALLQAVERRDDDFLSHDLYIYEYPLYHTLLETGPALAGKHVVFDCHCVTPAKYFPDPLDRQFIQKSIRSLLILGSGHRVLVHSRFALDENARLSGVDRERFQVLPYPLEESFFAARAAGEREAWRERLGVGDAFVLLYVGRAAWHKGLGTLLAALARVRREMPEARLLVVGDSVSRGHETVRDSLLAEAARLGVGSAVRFTGRVPEADLPGHYAAADLFVTASEHEGFCLPVAEAMALGLPVVCTDAAALPETSGGVAPLFPVGDAESCAREILALARDRGRMREQAERGRVAAARYRQRALAPAYLAFFDEVLRMPPKPVEGGAPLLDLAARLEVDYRDTSRRRWLGPLVSAIRSRFTWHLERFFVRELQRNFQLFASLASAEVRRLSAQVERLGAEVAVLRERVDGGGGESAGDWSRARRLARERNANHHARMGALREQMLAEGTAAATDVADRQSYEALLAMVPAGDYPRVLELGAGSGRDLTLLRARGGHALGVEVHLPIIPPGGAEPIVNGQLEELPFRAGSFDLVTSRHVMEHVASPALALSEVRRVLRPGGVAAAITPHFFPDPEPAHVSVLSEVEWRAAYEAAGFEVLASQLVALPIRECHLVARRR